MIKITPGSGSSSTPEENKAGATESSGPVQGRVWKSQGSEPSLPDPQDTDASLIQKYGKPRPLHGRIGRHGGGKKAAQYPHVPSLTSYDWQGDRSVGGSTSESFP